MPTERSPQAQRALRLACGTALCLTVLQRAGGKRLAAADFVRGFDVQPGSVLGS